MRPWLKRFLATLAIAGLAVAALPWWLGAALPWIGRPLHLTFGSYRRIGYSRFAVDHTVYRHGPVQVTVSHAEADTPLLWLWRHGRGADRLITADGWAVAVDRSTTPSRPRRPPGMVSLHALLEVLDTHLSRWLPRAEVTNGVVGWPTGGFRLERAEWTPGHLDVSGLRWWAGEAAGRVVFGDHGVIAVEALEPDRSLRASLRWSGADAEGQAWVRDQLLRLSGHYAEQGWLPVHAEAIAPSWTLPADKPRWHNFYSSITGHGSAVWDHGTFAIAVQAKWKPRAVLAPPASVDARVTGDRHQWSIESLHVESPVADLALSAPLRFGYGVLPRFEHARLKARFDFDHWRQGPLKGRASALLDASGSANQIPQVVFSLEGSDLSWGRWKVDSLRAAGTWRNSTLAFNQLVVKSPDGTAAATGGYDFGTQTLDAAQAEFSLSQAVLARWLPPGMSAQSASATVRAAGRWPALTHDGSCVITAGRVGILKPMDLKASWHGEGFNLPQFHAAVVAGACSLVVDGSADRRGLQMKRALFSPSGSAPWTLQSPAQVTWSPAIQISGVRFAAPGGTALALDLGGNRAIEANLSEISLGWIRDLVAWKGPDILVHSLRFSGAWEKDALVFSSQAAAELRLGTRSAQVSFSAEDDGRGLEVRALRLEENGRSFASADGRLPLSWNRHGTTGPRFDPNGAIDFRVETDPTSPSWAALAAEFGLALEAPRANLRVHGTLRHLLGEVEAGVARLGPATGRLAWKVPPVENLSVSLRADASGIVLDHLNATFAGQPLSASGRIPLQAAEWDELTRNPAALWERAEARLDVADADLAPLARTFPDLLSPRGRWRLHVDLARGQWKGAVQVENAALRPMGGLGLVQGINGDLLFHGRTVEIQSLVAEIGGQEVRIGGRAEFPAGGRANYSLSLKGRDIPVVRQAGLVIRADLDLAANTAGRQTRVSGRVNVIDGILLGDLADLIPSGTAGGQRPPPYFSVEAAPFDGWLLDVDVAAEQTLRVRTTLFSGTASAQFHLAGTLGDPRAIGQLRVASGQVSLPFATFDIQFGSVRLTADDPFHPQLDVTATARTYDYDLRMEARGGADDPIITFSSNPPVPSDQVLLLVMTGQVPAVGGVAGTAPSQVAGLGAYLGQSLFSSVGSGGGDNRLAVISGQEISISGKPTYEVDYKLGSRWWLVGEYDVFDDYNAGVKWRVISKGGKP